MELGKVDTGQTHVLDQAALPQEPLWASQPIITLGNSSKFVTEVVSSNWQNDYARQLEDHALLGIPEYWIADYQGIGGEFFIGRPKQPMLTVCILNPEGRYDRQLRRGDQRITSSVFPDLNLTAKAILEVGRDSKIGMAGFVARLPKATHGPFGEYISIHTRRYAPTTEKRMKEPLETYSLAVLFCWTHAVQSFQPEEREHSEDGITGEETRVLIFRNSPLLVCL